MQLVPLSQTKRGRTKPFPLRSQAPRFRSRPCPVRAVTRPSRLPLCYLLFSLRPKQAPQNRLDAQKPRFLGILQILLLFGIPSGPWVGSVFMSCGLIGRAGHARGGTSAERFPPQPLLKDAQLALVQSVFAWRRRMSCRRRYKAGDGGRRATGGSGGWRSTAWPGDGKWDENKVRSWRWWDRSGLLRPARNKPSSPRGRSCSGLGGSTMCCQTRAGLLAWALPCSRCP